VKRVPDTSEAEVIIAGDGRTVEERDLVFDINECDRYALEEAVLLKEKFGGTVTALTLGPEGAADTLRRCLATGADRVIMLSDAAFAGSDAVTVAHILYRAIKDIQFDLVLAGAQASDDLQAQVGPVLAELLGTSHATIVTHLEIMNGKAKVHRELEGGLEAVVEIKLPAVITIQTGINVPRYVSIMGIRKAARQEIKQLGLSELGLKESEVGEAGSKTRVERLFLPVAEKNTEILTGSLGEIAARLAGIIRDKGGLV